ncbi:MAG: TylF/MycF/NovP-related O-methyltransferase [Deltaproteobacteria bacterium]|nr:TylF/MycF/NovP-related O-methyltransferase [Deltaproteobacteria bacterium]
MSGQRRSTDGWKRRAIDLVDALLLRLPFVSELLNHGVSKSLGILAGFHLLRSNRITGDYLEFGVFRGETFRNAIRAAQRVFRDGALPGRFVAFDSFAGLPAVASMGDGVNPYAAGEFAAAREEFEATLGSLRTRVPIEVVAGWFDATLTPQTAARLALRRAAFVNIDCDLYESTVAVLAFITPLLQTGTILYFDDWYSYGGSVAQGEARAAREWLERSPGIQLVEYRNVGLTGKMFVVNLG